MLYLFTYNYLVSGNQYKVLAGTDEPHDCGQIATGIRSVDVPIDWRRQPHDAWRRESGVRQRLQGRKSILDGVGVLDFIFKSL